MTTRPWLLCCMLLSCVLGSSCGELAGDDDVAVPLDKDLRDYARDARANLAHLTPEQRALVEPLLEAHEQAISHYDRLSAQGQTRRAVQGPLLAAGAVLFADDATVAGVADDVALPFVALGVVATMLLTNPPATDSSRTKAYRAVMESAQAVSHVMKSSRIDVGDRTISDTQSRAEPGTREHCIDLYVDCQMTARWGFPRGRCQTCMDRCLGSGTYEWPDARGCSYR